MSKTVKVKELTVKDLNPAPYNPRKITDEKLSKLHKLQKTFGNLSGVIFNLSTDRLIGGHQTLKGFSPDWKITKEPFTDSVGTVAIGFIETPYGKFPYREVKWTEKKEMAANIAANKGQLLAEWDYPLLKDSIEYINDGEFDIESTGFDLEEIELLMIYPGKKPEPEEETEPKQGRVTEVTCTSCGHLFQVITK